MSNAKRLLYDREEIAKPRMRISSGELQNGKDSPKLGCKLSRWCFEQGKVHGPRILPQPYICQNQATVYH